MTFVGGDLDTTGLAIILAFYLLVAGVGVWAGWKNRDKGKSAKNGYVVGGRDINMFVGIFTMTATWVGGGYINGSAEAIYSSGLLWCQSPVGYSLSMIVGGLFYAKRMRASGATTMIDPLQKVYGRFAGALLVIPAVMGELFWSASILAALGSTLAVILNLPVTPTIIVSAAVAVFYTLFGGIYAVAYTDVIQMILMIIGLFLAIPFVLTNKALPEEGIGLSYTNDSITNEITEYGQPIWIGEIKEGEIALWIDSMIMLIFGGLPWQAYFQRVLSAESDKAAQTLSFVAPAGCILLVIPPILIGAGARVADWDMTALALANFTTTGFDNINDYLDEYNPSILPLALKYLTPSAVAYIGLGAVAAAVMSSADSSLLSAASLVTVNVVQEFLLVCNIKIGNKIGGWILKFNILALGSIATIIAITYSSVYKLFYFCSDLVFVLLFPQLTAALFIPQYVNPIGSIVAFAFGAMLRLLSGEEVLKLPVYMKWPLYDEETQTQYFPFKTVCMVCTFIMLLLASATVRALKLDHILRWEEYELHEEESPSKEELQPTPTGGSPLDSDREPESGETGLQNEAYF